MDSEVNGDVCKNNVVIRKGGAIMIQVTMIFTFLTIFFFFYVVEVENEEFKTQMDLVVDELMKDVDDNLSSLINDKTELSPDEKIMLISGMINVLERKIELGSEESVQKVLEMNVETRNKAFTYLSITIAVVIGLAMAVIGLGYCIPVSSQVIEGAYVVVFVGLTELIFLKVIASRYISADPYEVKRTFSKAVQDWIAANK